MSCSQTGPPRQVAPLLPLLPLLLVHRVHFQYGYALEHTDFDVVYTLFAKNYGIHNTRQNRTSSERRRARLRWV